MAPSYSNSTLSDPETESLLSVGSSIASCNGVQNQGQNTQSPNLSAAQAAKAIDMAEGQAWIPSTPSRPASLATASSDHFEADRRGAVLDAGPAPPDYAQATAQQSFARVHPLVDEDSLYAAENGIASFDRSESGQKADRYRNFVKRHWKSICLVNLAIYCLLTTAVLVLKTAFRQETAMVKFERYPLDHPMSTPGDVTEGQPERFHQSTKHCHFNSYSPFYYFGWVDPPSFYFEETVQQPDDRDFENATISGNVEIRPAPYGQTEPIQVVVNFATTSSWQSGIPEWSHGPDQLRIYRSSSHENPHSLNEHSDLKREEAKEAGCLDIWVGIYINTQLDNFGLHTENLNVDIGPSRSSNKAWWSFRIRNQSQIYSRKGNVTTSDWDSRDASVRSDGGSIKGTYTLNNNLDLETQSGDINVVIWHGAAHEKGYLTSHPPNTPANFSTASNSGNQVLMLPYDLNPLLWAGYLGLGYPYLLNSSHYSEIGSISLEAGDLWEGEIHARSVDGSISLEGKDLKLLPDPIDDIPFGSQSKHVWARKGTFEGSTTIETRGDISIFAGDFFRRYIRRGS